jgi:hypothetical protein
VEICSRSATAKKTTERMQPVLCALMPGLIATTVPWSGFVVD